eukprot:1156138-Pelagomonas_calceolata.AAC.23
MRTRGHTHTRAHTRTDADTCAHTHTHASTLTEVHEHWHCLGDVQLAIEVEGGVGKQVEGGRAGGEVRAPPPMVVLRAQLEVAEHDGDLRARDQQDDEHQRQEAKQVVELQE